MKKQIQTITITDDGEKISMVSDDGTGEPLSFGPFIAMLEIVKTEAILERILAAKDEQEESE